MGIEQGSAALWPCSETVPPALAALLPCLNSPRPSPMPQLCRQLRQRGWRVFALCRRSSPELDALSTPAAGATNRQQPVSESGGSSGSLTVVESVDVASDGCVALLQVRALRA